MAGGAPLLDRDVKVDCKGDILDCWLDDEVGVGGKHSNHSREETLLRNIACCGA